MKLIYHLGKNFGDALNPLIFETLLPYFFDDNPEIEFLGIGSILGLKRPDPEAKKMIVFSSGFGGGDESTYGRLPKGEEFEKYDFRCVRGPLTARALGLPEELGICDGAFLLPEVIDNSPKTKKYSYSYIPHIGSLAFFPQWAELLKSVDIHLIDPREEIHFVINEIQQTEIVLAEAMHGAIVSDALRVPWIPIKTNKTINEFKWTDFCSSLGITFEFNHLPTLFSKDMAEGIIQNKLAQKGLNFELARKTVSYGYNLYQSGYLEKTVLNGFQQFKNAKTYLSADDVFISKKDMLLDLLYKIKEAYS